MRWRSPTTRTFVIDSGRNAQNEWVAAKLLALQDRLEDRLTEGDLQAWQLLDTMHRKTKALRSPALRQPMDLIASDDAFAAADQLRAMSVGPLRKAIRTGSIVFTVSGDEYTPREPLPWIGHTGLNIIAPLTWHVCMELLVALGNLTIQIYDPSSGAPLSIERARYASEQAELIRVEHSLWELASEYGGPTDRTPYAYRLVLLLMAWDPVAHEAPSGAWTLCARCGRLLHRKRSFDALPRCEPCMKENAKQREWPSHAVAPHRQGTWLLRCVYPGCSNVFEGRRHRKLCDDHTSSKLSLNRRLATYQAAKKRS